MTNGLLLSLAGNLVLAAALAVALIRILRYREARKQRGIVRPWPIRRVEIDRFDARFATTPLGPARDTEIRFIAGFRVAGGISDLESWILCVLARRAERIFEFGTCTGKTTYLLAANAPPAARVTTLTLKPEDQGAYRAAAGDDAAARDSAIAESAFAAFFYENAPEAAKITQLIGDSKAFDETPFLASCDLVFVDGAHARSYVESDSRKALRMVKPGGIVLWHDYSGRRRTPGVFAALNALARELPLVHIAGTTLVAYRRPAA
jgi:predicted O-methyltransferase YrrM